MALIKLASHISDIRGKLGGSIFQKGASGHVMKANSSKKKNQSKLANEAQAITSAVQQSWISLSQSDQNLWSQYALYNCIKQKNISGHFINGQQAFIKFNVYRKHYSKPVLTTPTFAKCAIEPVTLTVSLTGGGSLQITSSRPMVPASEFIILHISSKQPIGRNTPKGALKVIKFATTAASVFDINSAYIDVFGYQLVSGDTIFLRSTTADNLSGLPFPFTLQKVTLA